MIIRYHSLMQKHYWVVITTATVLIAGLSFGFSDKLQEAFAGETVNDQSECLRIEHWDKVIFFFPKNKVIDTNGIAHRAGSVFDYKFVQQPPVAVPTDITQQTLDHLSNLGWTLGSGAPIAQRHLFIIDIDYNVLCLDGTIPL